MLCVQYPHHFLFKVGIEYAKKGGFIDLTTSSDPKFLEPGELRAGEGLALLLICVGNNCVGGISVSSIILNKYSNLLAPSPKWTLTIPAFPDNNPPTLDCATVLTNSWYDACELMEYVEIWDRLLQRQRD